MTVKELYKNCLKQIQKGNGDKTIYISDDEEGNGYHELFYSFTEEVAEYDMYGQIEKPKESIILG